MNYLHQEGFPAINQLQSARLQSVHSSVLCSPPSTLTPSLGTATARHSARALQDFLQKEWISGQSRAEVGSSREVETWLPVMLVGSCEAVVPGVWQQAGLLESVQLCSKWKP